ncbi:hypothetical protein RFI_21477 [Reticulomyxa filosa]|uniref:Uncharacterized protein n=1 Tax=Reticulomyxa filosa TaxID=46433 RepID=X6MR48_RETFI|nr:hypothetical protein RFI_21477 [Reticulomyxa filosa]|eukprot:ETO15887.1 hypothetical protein RFI_21477 [Reticulomyxa filosa]
MVVLKLREKERQSIPWRNTKDFGCIVAIDFGTDGTAMAINMKGSKGVHSITDWSSSGVCDSKETEGKTKTALLVDEKLEPIAFGNEAWNKLKKSAQKKKKKKKWDKNGLTLNGIHLNTEKRYQAPNNKDADKWLLFHRFKMNLYGEVNLCQGKQPTLHDELQSINGVSVKSETVFVGALQYCKKKAMQYLTQNKLTVDENKIQWVITVPAIWSEEAKGMMKQWAQQAKLWDTSVDNQLIIALEPECASVCVMLEMKDNPNQIQFKTGDCYMMMDLGAGTADMVCHEITGPFEVREMIASFGGPWGGSYVNDDILKIIRDIFGEEHVNAFQSTHPKQYLQLLDNIESSKQRFFKIQKKTGTHRIEIPFEFDEFMRKKLIDDLEKLVSNFRYLDESGHEYDHEYLSLSCQLWIKLFDLRIDRIIEAVQQKLSENAKILNGKLKYMCLVGGFSQSPYLQHRLKQSFEQQFTLVIPTRPILSVIEGAAQLGRISSFVTSRIVKYTYGAGASWPIKDASLHEKINEEHIQKHKYTSEVKHKEYVGDCFDVFVDKDDEIKVDQTVERSYGKRSKNKKTARVSIYRSEERDPGVITGCERLGKLDIPYPNDFDETKDKFYVRFYFGETMIRVTVIMKGKEYVEHEVQIKYDFGVQHVDID